MEIRDLIAWLKIQIQKSHFFVHLINGRDVSDPIVKAIKEIPEIPEVDTKKITQPIVEAQKLTTAAIKAIPATIIPETDFSSLEGKLDALKTALEAKEMVVNIGKTKVNVDTESVVKAIEKLEKNLPKLEQQEVVDYTLMLDEMVKIMERPVDNAEIIKIQKLLENLATTSDMSVIGEWLKEISERPQFDLNKYLDKDGQLKVKVDRVGGGGGGLTQIESVAIQGVATEETLQDVKTVLQAQGSNGQPVETIASDYVLTFGGLVSGDISNTYFSDGSSLEFSETDSGGGGLTFELNFNGTPGPSQYLGIVGYYQGGGSHYLSVYAYNWNTLSYDQISTSNNKFTSSNGPITYTFPLLPAHTDPTGNVNIKMAHNVTTYFNSHRFFIDKASVYYLTSVSTQLKNTDNVFINPAIEEYQNPLSAYQSAGMDITANPYYFGYLNVDGKWYIKKLDTTLGTTYVRGDTDYATNWAGRTEFSYNLFNIIFN